MKSILLILVTFLLRGSDSSSTKNEWELELVQIVFRNGISAPAELYPTDPNDPEAWEDGLDQLTLMGKKQLYAIGEDLKKRYGTFLSSNPQEVKLQSTYNDKCMSSALCLLASLYEPTPSWEFIQGLNWQPVPVHYIPPHRDKVLGTLKYCPPVNKELKYLESINSFKTIVEMYEKQLNYWSINSGMTMQKWNQASELYEILSTEYASNQTIPEWAWKYWEDLECLNDFWYKMIYSNTKILKYVGGPLLRHMVRNAVSKSEGHLRKTKICIFFGQSEHIAGVLGALKAFNDKAPPFASSIFMELFKREDQDTAGYDFRVKFSFLNATDSHDQVETPRTLVFPDCDELCPLNYISNNTKKWENKRWVKDCERDLPIQVKF